MSTRLERIAKKIHEALPPGANVVAKFGKRALKTHDKPRRIVWISPGGDINPAKRTNGTLTNEAGKPERISIIADRYELIEAHLFAEDADRLEALLDGVIAAIHNTLGPVAPYPWKYGWSEESQDGGQQANVRPKIVLFFTAQMPVSEQALGLRTIVSIQHGHADKAVDPPHTEPHGP